jgi:thymidylate synthase (FAD)
MYEVEFRDDMTVELLGWRGSDHLVAEAARVSTGASTDSVDVVKDTGLINYLMRERHGSPFEHNSFNFYIEAPIFVFREFQRHRIASYNEESGRYKELEPVFYTPAEDRKLVQVGKVGHYEFVEGTREQHAIVSGHIATNSYEAYASYRSMLDEGIAKEVARMVLPLNIYSSMYVTMNARGLMNFLSLRTSKKDAKYFSSPQREIEMVAEKMEELWAETMPITHAAFAANGWVAP